MTDQPPHDLAAEMATLGAMLLSKDAITDVAPILRADHFYRPNFGDIYDVILSLSSSGEPVDAVTVAHELESRGKLRRIGGGPAIHELTTAVPSPVGASYYARIVYDKWRQRQIIMVGQRFVQLGYEDATSSEEVDGLLAQADSFFRELGEPASSGLQWDDLVDKWREWQAVAGDVIHTPWNEVNAWFPGKGLHPGQLAVVAGRPGSGKSAAGLNIALGAAEHGRKTVVFSVEMDDVEVCSRLLAAGGWTKVGQLFSKDMDLEVQERVEGYIAKSRGMPMQIVDNPGISVEEIVAHCRATRPACIFVDYCQLMTGNPKTERRDLVAHITRSLKVAAKQLQMVVIAAAQLNRESTRFDNNKMPKTPSLSDLAESDAIGRDADIVMFLQRQEHSPKVRVICVKNRNGVLGTADLPFRGHLARIG